MKAFAYVDKVAPGTLQFVTRPDPDPGPHDVVIRIRAAALNYRDLAIARGHYHIGVRAPLIPLSDGAGDVVAAGSKVTRFRVGDLACPVYLPDWIDGPISPRLGRRRLGGPSDGVLAEFVCINEEEAVRAPSHLTAAEAATLPVTAVTAWQALHQTGRVRPGETVVVQGAGGMSVAAILLARAAGARVISITRRTHHRDRLLALGATEVISDDGADLVAQVLAASGGSGADSVVDIAGGNSVARSIAMTRVGGLVHLVGYAADTSATIDIFDAIRHAVTLHVAAAGSRQSFEALCRALEALSLHPPVDKALSLDHLGEAFEQLDRCGGFGKVVLDLETWT